MKKSFILSMALGLFLFANEITFKEAPQITTRINPQNDETSVLSYNKSIKEVKKSVVNISTTKIINSNNFLDNPFNDPIFREFFSFKFDMPKRKQKATSLGSGVIISQDGYIVTNNHVVEGGDEILVTLYDSPKEFKAKIIGSDPKTDIAIIKIEAKNLAPISFANSSDILEGDLVFAIGNPYGMQGSISSGIISALNKNNIGLNQYEDFIQTDASINPGNSGGALVDSRGALIGINSAILSRGGGNDGIGFAIPSNMVKQIASKLIKDGKISRGYIGVVISDLTKDQKEVYKNKFGALIVNIEKNSPAAKAGLKRGDLIIKIDSKIIKNSSELKNLIGSLNPNKKINIEFERANKNLSADITLESTENSALSNLGEYELEGLKIANLNHELKNKFQIRSNVIGAIITEVKPSSKAYDIGFVPGDVIVQVNEQIIKNVGELKKSIEQSKKENRKPMIWINRSGLIIGLVLKL